MASKWRSRPPSRTRSVTVWRGFRPSLQPDHVELLAAGQAQRLGALAGHELERQHAHADQVRAVDALVALGQHGPTPSSAVPLAAQSRDEPLPYSRPAMTSSGTLSRGVAHRRVVDEHLVARSAGAWCTDLPCRPARCAAGCCRTCRASSPRGGRAARRSELNSSGVTPCSCSHWPAGLQAGIEPAGEMWSVVTESPSTASTRAPSMSLDRRRLGASGRRRTAAARRRSSRASHA